MTRMRTRNRTRRETTTSSRVATASADHPLSFLSGFSVQAAQAIPAPLHHHQRDLLRHRASQSQARNHAHTDPAILVAEQSYSSTGAAASHSTWTHCRGTARGNVLDCQLGTHAPCILCSTAMCCGFLYTANAQACAMEPGPSTINGL